VADWGFLKGLLTAFQKAENIALIFRGLSPPVSPRRSLVQGNTLEPPSRGERLVSLNEAPWQP